MDFVQALEDFQAVSALRSFSLAAKARAVTQPALSRRIQRLESWIGVELIDRRGKPIVLTGAGQLFHDQVTPLLSSLNEACRLIRGNATRTEFFSVQAAHALCFGLLPRWLQQLRDASPTLRIKVIPAHFDDAMRELARGTSDLVVAYGHAALPVPFDDRTLDCFRIGHDHLLPVALADSAGLPRFTMDDARVSYLAYTEETFLARAVSLVLLRSNRRLDLRRAAESSMAEVLKRMVLEGLGLAWIPRSCVIDELRSGKLALAGGIAWQLPLEVQLYRPSGDPSSGRLVDALRALIEKDPRLGAG
jgi:LysR family transcriptional regulator, hypochlorite-specific transcription factor HypT